MAQSCEERLHKMHKVYEEAYQFQEKRIHQLEGALREVQKRVESYDMYLADMEGKIDSGIREIRYIVDAALSPSEAPEKEGEDG